MGVDLSSPSTVEGLTIRSVTGGAGDEGGDAAGLHHDAALTLTQQAPLSGAVIVTTANDLSLIDARKGLQMFQKVNVPVLGIIENMSYFTPPEPEFAGRKYHIFGEGGGQRIAAELRALLRTRMATKV